jgi:hypothetical protein
LGTDWKTCHGKISCHMLLFSTFSQYLHSQLYAICMFLGCR